MIDVLLSDVVFWLWLDILYIFALVVVFKD